MRKRVLSLLLCLLLCLGLFPLPSFATGDRYLEINETNFPDDVFRQYIIDTMDMLGNVCGNAEDGYYMTSVQVANVVHIRAEGLGIRSLKGIEHFTELDYLSVGPRYDEDTWEIIGTNCITELDLTKNTALVSLYCDNNQLTALDVSKCTELRNLVCSYNQLTALDVTKNTALEYLACVSNQLTALDVSKCTELRYLSCDNNQLTALNVSKNTALKDLSCDNNQLTALDVTKNTALEYMYCDNNQLTALNVTKNSALERLYCRGNRLTALDVTKCTELMELDCGVNQLTVLDVTKNTALVYMYCDNNQLTALDVSKCTELWLLTCSYNQLTALDLTKNTALGYLYCNDNQLTALDVTKCTALGGMYCDNNQLTALNVTKNSALERLFCRGNRLTALDVTKCTELMELDCGANHLTVLDVTKNTALGYLYCYDNQLTALDVSKCTALVYLECENNQLTALDVSQCTKLESLYCYDNQLTALNVSKNTALVYMNCESNQLTALNVSKNTALTHLYCDANQLTALDVSKCTALEHLECENNQLTALNVSKNTALEYMYCYNNQLTALDVSKCTALEYLECYNNRLTALQFGDNASLSYIDCGYNQLTQLDLSGCSALQTIYCQDNQLTSLDMRGNPELEMLLCQSNQLTSIDVSQNPKLYWLACRNNQLSALDLSQATALETLICYGNHIPALDLSANVALTRTDMNQTIEDQTLTAIEGGWQFALSTLVPLENMARVTLSGDGVLDEDSGVVTFATEVGTFAYQYDTGRGQMNATVAFGKAEELIPPTIVSSSDAEVHADLWDRVDLELYADGANITYAWYEKAQTETDWTLLDGLTDRSVYLYVNDETNGCRYRCVAANKAGSVSMETVIWVNGAPVIATEPTDQTANEGEKVTFTVEATGDKLSYRWQYRKPGDADWTNVSKNGTSATYSLTAAAKHNGYAYRCAVKNAAGTTYSKTVTLTVKVKPTITTQPVSVTVNAGKKATFTVVATGADSYKWQYQKPGSSTWTSVSKNGDAATYTLTTEAKHNGYAYRCAVKNEAGTVYTDAVTLTVQMKPTITTQPASVTVAEGKKATFTVVATGADSYKWQYQKPGSSTWTSVSKNGDAATYTLTTAAKHNGYAYRCAVKNAAGTVYTNAVTLTVKVKPTITTQPKAVTVYVGKKASFTVVADGAESYKWQYQKPGSSTWTNVSSNGAAATYTLTTAAKHDGYAYRCAVQNAAGTTYTDAVKLTVSVKPVITTQPKAASVTAGKKATFKVVADGAESYKWQYQKPGSSTWTDVSKNGTSATYTLTTAAKHNGYKYRCKITNAKGSVYTSIVTLTVK